MFKCTNETEQSISADEHQKAVLEERKKIGKWLEKHYLVKPDANSLTQFYPFYQIEQRDIELLKQGKEVS
jgi:hypothetical protein